MPTATKLKTAVDVANVQAATLEKQWMVAMDREAVEENVGSLDSGPTLAEVGGRLTRMSMCRNGTNRG